MRPVVLGKITISPGAPFPWIIIALAGWLTGFVAQSHHPEKHLNLVHHALIFTATTFVLTMIHESGHALMNHRNGRRLRYVHFTGTGVRTETGPRTYRQQINISLAGPLLGIIAALTLVAYLHGFLDHPMSLSSPAITAAVLASSNDLLNLVPLGTSDGSRLSWAITGVKQGHSDELYGSIDLVHPERNDQPLDPP